MGEYRDAATRPRFSFGFGLHGSTVSYGPPAIRPAAGGQPPAAVVTITNTGGRTADEVVQLYVRQMVCAQGARPAQELRGFQHVTLAPAEAKQVTFALTDTVLGYFHRDGRFVTDVGDYHIWIAPQSETSDPVLYDRK
jgi:beta-glucosidase